jgi:cell wall-associated NlpC family hydrolase
VDPVTATALAGWAHRHWKLLAGGAVAVVLAAVGGLLAAAGPVMGLLSSQSAQGLSRAHCVAHHGRQPAWQQWSSAQMTNAAIITATGRAQQIPAYGLVIALATAMQESSLHNLHHGTADALGLFQQRPSQGWGTAQQITNPVYAASQFYRHLLAVPGWQRLPLAQAAQAVQHSAHPNAYAKWRGPAEAVAAHITRPAALASARGACGAAVAAMGSGQQLGRVLAYAHSALGTMYQYGGTCTSPHSSNTELHCDCSSLVQMSFAQARLRLPRTVEQQWQWAAAGHAEIIPPSQAQIGDVIYVPTYLGPNVMGHTGIIINPARHLMIDAPSSGHPVRVDSYSWAVHDRLFRVVQYITATGAQ